ncbi:hypothetical protein [Henriciella litoralis]|nr:hypothetical protein [Henriciella litoralis]
MTAMTDSPGNNFEIEDLFERADLAAERAGLRMTRIRRHVYRLLLEADEPLSAYHIADRLDGIGSPKPATAYRALDCLEKIMRDINTTIGIWTPASNLPARNLTS